MKARLGIIRGMALTLGLVAVGCGAGTGPAVPVRGTVFFKGVPLRSGFIVFVPDASRGGRGSLACAPIREDGSYSLQTGGSSGVPGGWYRVTVAAVEPPPLGATDPEALPRSILPDKYRDPELSGLTCQVTGMGANTVDFHLD
jgi:hypothetical protein